jgi:hypothetical protein
MVTVLEHELTASWMAGSLGGTLGRLSDSLRRLSRTQSTGSREKPETAAVLDRLLIEPARLSNLNQTLRLMTDAWESHKTATLRFNRIEEQFNSLTETALDRLNGRAGRPMEYYRLAQVIEQLRGSESHWVM